MKIHVLWSPGKDPETCTALGNALDAHVRACFLRERALLDALENDEFEPGMIDQGWP